jgi:hypothetical protein
VIGHTLLAPFSFLGDRRIKDQFATIRRVPDDLWLEIAPILGDEKKPDKGRPPVPFRKVLDGILYVLRTGASGRPSRGSMAQGRRPTADSSVGERGCLREDMGEASRKV